MLTILVIAAGLGLLLVAGGYQLTTARLSGPDAKRSQLLSEQSTTFTRGDLEDPTRILENGRKLQNALVVVLEIAAIVMAVWMSTLVYTVPTIQLWFKLLVVAALVVGSLLVGRGIYVRLGLYQPVTVREALRYDVGAETAEDFATIREVSKTARGDATLDEATAGLLAAAKNGRSMETVREWAESEDVAPPETFEQRARTLDEAGVIRCEGEHLSLSAKFDEAGDDQIATVAASVLN